MSFGKSSSKSKNSQNNTLDQWSKDKIEGILGPAMGLLNGVTPQAYTGALGAGLDPAQLAAQSAAEANMGRGSDLVAAASSAAQAAGGYKPQNVQAGNVQAQTLRGTSLEQYLNPYMKNVAGNVLSDLDEARRMAITGTQGEATKAGAFGGSRHGVADSLTNTAFGKEASSRLNSLYSDAFGNAQQGAQFDIGNALGASLANQGANLNASLANQNAGLQGNAQGIQAAGLLGNLGQLSNQLGQGDAAFLNMFGQQNQATQQNANSMSYDEWVRQQNQPLQIAGAMGGLLGGVPAIVDSKGSSKGSGSTFGYAYSDARLKSDIIHVLTDGKGVRWYDYTIAGRRERGVMAQEVALTHPHAVAVDASGFLMVDYGAL